MLRSSSHHQGRVLFSLSAVALLCASAWGQQPLFTFAQISDSQPNDATDNARFVEVLQTLAASGTPGALLPRRVNFVVFAGDITDGNTSSEWNAALQKLNTHLTANGIPVMYVPGNHDVSSSGSPALYEQFIAESDVWNIGSASFMAHNGFPVTTGWTGLRIIGFNSTNPDNNTVSSGDLSQISALVSAAGAAQENVFLLNHHGNGHNNRTPLAGILPNPNIVCHLHGHSGSPHITKGISGISNPNLWPCDSNAIYQDRDILYFDVYQNELRGHVIELPMTSLPAPARITLVHALRAGAEQSFGIEATACSGARNGSSGRSPERKLWREGNTWFAVLWSDSSNAYRIHRKDANDSWTNIGPTVSSTSGRTFDALRDSTKLCIASTVASVPTQSGSGQPGQLSRFTYNSSNQTYALDSGFPVSVNDARTKTLVLARDTTGVLWAAWVQSGTLFVNRTVGSDTTWGTPTQIATGLGASDGAALVAFSGQVGLLWSNLNGPSVSFAVHADGASNTSWVTETLTSTATHVGDQIDLVASSGRVFAAVRATGGTLSVFRRAPGGGWARHEAGTPADDLKDPLLVIDDTFGLVRLFATSSSPNGLSQSGGGAIWTKSTLPDAPSFPPGKGTPVILDGAAPANAFATSTHQPVIASSDLVVMASNDSTDRYWQAIDTMAAAPATPTAEFVAGPLSGPAPLAVAFDDQSTGSPTYWLWSFGDGATSNEKEPQHVYSTAGLYTVTLTVANGGGQNVRTRTSYVNVTPPPPTQTFLPIADARASESSPTTTGGTASELRVKTQAGSSYQSFVRFDVSALGGNVQSAKLRLFCTDNGNGNVGVHRLVTDTWTETGLNWSNKPGLVSPAVGVMPNDVVGAWSEVDVSSVVTGTGIVSFGLGGGTTSSVYYSSREGTNPPQLVVTTTSGGATPPTASFSGTPVSGPAPLNVSFTDSSTGSPNAWSWSFGDGQTSNVRNPSHVYDSPGTYTVSLDASNGSGSDNHTINGYIVVSDPPPTRTFLPVADTRTQENNATKNYGLDTTLRVKNQAGGSNRSFLRFDLSSLGAGVLNAKLRLYCVDASTSGGQVVAISSAGWTETGVNWLNQPAPGTPLAALGAVVLDTWVEVDVTSHVTGAGLVSFGLSGGSTNSAYYSSREGAHPPELVVLTGAVTQPTADFTATPTSGPAPLSVGFSDTSTGGPTAWSWNFGDGTSSTQPNPTHVYATPGTYTVSLQVSNSAGNSTKSISDLISVGPPAPITTYFPIADSRVNQSSPTSNAGLDIVLRTREDPVGSYHTYLTFDLSSVSAPIASAKLRLFVTDGGPVSGVVFATTTSWGETTINWNNKPASIGNAIATGGAVADNTWVEFDVTSAVGAGPVGFVLRNTQSNSLYYSSREGANPPQLVITTTTARDRDDHTGISGPGRPASR